VEPDPFDLARCKIKTGDQRRCQLFADHKGPHAHLWRVRTGPPRRGTFPFNTYLIRWRDDGLEPWHEVPGTDRLRWCSMGRVDPDF
jgi:hypothetical protein